MSHLAGGAPRSGLHTPGIFKSKGTKMELRKRASYRRACVELLETRRLLSVTIPDGYLKLNASPIDIDATSSAQVSTGITLKTGANYFFVASGTHVLAPGRAADAQFYQQATTLNWVQGGGPHLHVTGVSSLGAYQSDHIYGVQAVGNGNELRPWISDSNFSDNSGHLSLDVYASFQADLEIYKPALIDTAQGMIADADEATVGSATFVNLDNDDNDTKFDDTDDVGIRATGRHEVGHANTAVLGVEVELVDE